MLSEGERHARLEQLFHAVRSYPPNEREEVLRRLCPTDASLRAEAEALLAIDSGFQEHEAPDLYIGPYKILGEVGRGNMGIVYRAYDPDLNRDVAIKTIQGLAFAQASEHAELRERFLREARAAAALSHPGIVPVFQLGEHRGQPYIVMEFVEGWPLRQLLRDSPRPPTRLLDGLLLVAQALDYAHSRRVIHRDVKPGNILVSTGGTFKITDFGIAKMLESPDLTSTSRLIGTPSYLAPEQLRLTPSQSGRSPVGPRSDQYSLAVISYEIVTRRLPYSAETTDELYYQIVAVPPPPASSFSPELNAGVDRILERALSKDPAQRFDTCAEFVTALHHAITQSAPEPLPVRSPPEQAKQGQHPARPVKAQESKSPIEPILNRQRLNWKLRKAPIRAGITVLVLAVAALVARNIGAIRAIETHFAWVFRTPPLTVSHTSVPPPPPAQVEMRGPPKPSTEEHVALNGSRITGEWYAIVRDPDYAPGGNQFFFRLKADGGRLFGTVTRVYDLHSGETDGYRNGISDGKVEGDRISFWYIGGSKNQDAEGHVTELKDLFYGLFSGDAIHFTYQVEGELSVEFTAKRVASANPRAGSNPIQSPEAGRTELGRMSLQYTPEAFIRSAGMGDLTAVKLFLTAGMNPNTTDDEGDTALMYAAYKGHTKIVAALVEAGADVNQRKGHQTALLSAAGGGHVDSLRVLLDKRPDADAINGAFVEAVRMRHHEIVRFLVNRGANVKKVGSLAMMVLADGGWGDEDVSGTVKFLLNLGADPNGKSEESWTALMVAAKSGYPSAVRLLLERGADVNAKCVCPGADDGGWTALMLATKRRNLEVVETLLGKSADVNQRNNRGETALILAAYSGDTRILQAVLDRAVDVNVKRYDGRTALMGVAEGTVWPDGVVVDYPEAVRSLLARGADVNIRDVRGITSLMVAAESGSTAVVRSLLQAGARVNEQDDHGYTALRFARDTLKGQRKTEMVRLLEGAGAK
jgi:serine/threonine protein kinase/ankyrin repeat protein